jgi:spermidine synthase
LRKSSRSCPRRSAAISGCTTTQVVGDETGKPPNPKVTIHIDDARHFLLTTNQTFDAITSDPLDPWVKGAATLYSEEFFTLAKSKLRPGGVVTLFVQLYESNTAAVKSEIGTFMKVFPNSVVWGQHEQWPGLRPGADGTGRTHQDQSGRDGSQASESRSSLKSRSPCGRSGFNSGDRAVRDVRGTAH